MSQSGSQTQKENYSVSDKAEERVKRARRDETRSTSGNQSISTGDSAEELFEIFRKKILSRGTRGIQSLGKLFRIIDDDGSRCISFSEFSKICKDLRIGFTDV